MDYRLGPWLVRPALNSVERSNEVVHVTPKAMQVLTLLAERAPEVVRKEDIFEQVWPGAFVTDDALTRCIGELRKALHDEAQEPTIIKTVPRRGYFVVAEVRPAQAAIATAPPHRSRRIWAIAAAIVAVAVLVILAALRWPAKHTDIGHIRRIAVLPLVDLSAPPRNEYFADSVTDELIGQIAHINRWQVISMTSVMRYKGAKEPLRKIAADLDVEGVIEGTIQRVDSKVRITAQLIDARADTHLWFGRFEHETGDLLSLQSSIARSIADELHIELSADEQKRLARPKVNPEAYEEYLKGMHFVRKTEYAKAAEYFEKATRLDPQYGLAYALLAESLMTASSIDQNPRSDAFDAALQSAQRLAPDLAETRTLLANRKFFRERKWAEGLEELRLAASRDPGSVRAAIHYGTALHTLRRWDEAEREYQRALKLDPLSYATRITVARLYLDSGRLDRAAAEYHKAIELEPQQFAGYWRLGNISEELGHTQDAIGWYIKAHSIPKEEFRREPLVTALKTGGIRAYWSKRIELETLPSRGKESRGVIGVAYIQLGETAKALDLLERIYGERPDALAAIYSNFHMNKLRGQPRFQALIKKMGFPPSPY